jgi:hypothetical protein
MSARRTLNVGDVREAVSLLIVSRRNAQTVFTLIQEDLDQRAWAGMRFEDCGRRMKPWWKPRPGSMTVAAIRKIKLL